MEGLTRAEIDIAESKDFALGGKPMRPRNAATLILLDRQSNHTLVLMGKRHAAHAFMPGKFVFPGGRTDPADRYVPVAEQLHPIEERKLAGTDNRACAARARAIALSAVRETYEEAGLLLGRKGRFITSRREWQEFVHQGVCPSLDSLRFIARAITPPGRIRRFDTHFLATWKSNVVVTLPGGGPTKELEELVWLPLDEARQADIPSITRTILEELERRLSEDPQLQPGGPVPFYRMVHNRFCRDII